MPKKPLSAALIAMAVAAFIATLAVVLPLALPMAQAAKTAIEIGTTVKVVNLVRAKTLNRRLKLGDRVVYRETVSTGLKSAVDIRLIDESTLVMGELTEMILDSMVYNPNRGVVEGALRAVKGIFRFSSAGVKMDLTITTPVGTIGVRGTEFDVLTDASKTEVAVHEGTIEVTSALGTQRVSRGQVYRVTAGGTGGFQDQPSPEMRQAVSLMLTLVADQGSGGQASPSSAQTSPEAPSEATTQTAALSPAAFDKAIQGKERGNLLYMDLSGGRLVIELRPDLAPRHVNRVKELARRGFYDGLGFHFVRPGYVAETGDPTGTGKGGSGQTLAAEFSDVPFERGTVGMSREEDDPDSADSQFFITLGRAERLDGKYTVIGKAILGLELADVLSPGRPPKAPDRIIRLRIGADVKD